MNKKTYSIIAVIVALTVLVTGCFLNSGKYVLDGIVCEENGNPAAFAKVFISGREYETDSRGRLSVTLEKGNYEIVAEEPGRSSDKVVITLNKDLSKKFILRNANATYGFIYRTDEEGLRATLVIPESLQPLAIRMEVDKSKLRGDIRKAQESAFLYTEAFDDYLQIDWSHIFRVEPENGIYKAFGLPVSEKLGIESCIIFQKGLKSITRGNLRTNSNAAVQRAPVYGVSDLAKVGDIASNTPAPPSNGVIDIWDLILLLNHYGESGTPAEGDLTGMNVDFARPNHPTNPQPFNIAAITTNLVPNGIVDIWDLIVLLNGYQLSLNNINTPFGPSSASYNSGTRVLNWVNVYDTTDVLDGYKVYQTSGNVVPADGSVPLATIAKGVLSHTFSAGQVTQSQLYVEAYNSSYRSSGQFVYTAMGIFANVLSGGTFQQGNATIGCTVEITEVDSGGNPVPNPDLSSLVLKRGATVLTKNTDYSVNDVTNRIEILPSYLNTLLSTQSPVTFTVEKTPGGVSTTFQVTVTAVTGKEAIVSSFLSGSMFNQGSSAYPAIISVSELDSNGDPVADPDLSQVEVFVGSSPLTKNSQYTVNDAENTISLLPVYLNTLQGSQSPVKFTVFKSSGGLSDYLYLTISTSAGKPTAGNLTLQGSLRVGSDVTALYEYFHPQGYPEGNSLIAWQRADDKNGTGNVVIYPVGTNPNPNVLPPNPRENPINDQTVGIRLSENERGKFVRFTVSPRSEGGILQGDNVESDWFGPVLAPATPFPATAPEALNVFVDAWDGVQYNREVGVILYGQYNYYDANGDAEAASVYQWYRTDDSSGTNAQIIGGAVARQYTITPADLGKYLVFQVTPKTLVSPTQGASVKSAGYGPVLGEVAPEASNLSISGTRNVGSLLTAVYTYFDLNGDLEKGSIFQWKQADNISGLNTVVIAGAQQKTWRVGQAQAGKYITVEVTPRNEKGVGALQVMTWVGPITNPGLPPQKPTADNIRVLGNPIEGQWLQGIYTYYDLENDPEGATVYRWYRVDSVSSSERVLVHQETRGSVVIPNRPNPQYYIQNADVGKYIQFEVTPKNTGNPGEGDPVFSSLFGPVQPTSNPPTAKNVTVNGSWAIGSLLTGNYDYEDSNGDPQDIANTKYKWQNANSAAGAGSADIPAAAKQYKPDKNDLGKWIRFGVQPASQNPPAEGVWAYSPWYGPISGSNPSPARPEAFNVSIQGQMIEGEPLTGVYQYFDINGDPEVGSTFKWFVADNASGLNQTEIALAAALVYNTIPAQVGKYLAFEVTPRNVAPQFPEGLPARSNWFGPISGRAIPEASDVSASGTLKVTDILTANYSYSHFNGFPEGDTVFLWRRANNAGGSGAAAIAGGVSRSYQLQPADLGKYIQVEITPHDYQGTAGAAQASTWVGPIVAAPSPTPGTPPVAFNVEAFVSNVVGVKIPDRLPVVGSLVFCNWGYFDANGDPERNTGVAGSTEIRWYRLDTPVWDASAARIVSKVEINMQYHGAGVPYTVVQADVGKYLICEILPKSDAGEAGEKAYSNILGPVNTAGGPFAYNVHITVDGDGVPKAGNKLTARYTYYHDEALPEGVSTVQWYLSDYNYESSARAVDTAIAGGNPLTLVAAHVGKYLRVGITPKDTVPNTGVEVRSAYYGPIQKAQAPKLLADEVNIWIGDNKILTVGNATAVDIAAWLGQVILVGHLWVDGVDLGAIGANWGANLAGTITINSFWSLTQPGGLKQVVVKVPGYTDAEVSQWFADGADALTRLNQAGTANIARQVIDNTHDARSLGLDDVHLGIFDSLPEAYRTLIAQGLLSQRPASPGYANVAAVQTAFDAMFISPGAVNFNAGIANALLPILFLKAGVYQDNFVVDRGVTIIGPNFGRCYGATRVAGAEIRPLAPGTPINGINGTRVGKAGGAVDGVVFDGLEFNVNGGYTLATPENTYLLYTFLAAGEAVNNLTVKNCKFDSSGVYGQPNIVGSITSPVSIVFTDNAGPGGGSVSGALIECNTFVLDSDDEAGMGFVGILAQLPGVSTAAPNKIKTNKFERVAGHSADLGRPYGIWLQNDSANHQIPSYWEVESNLFTGNYAYQFGVTNEAATTGNVQGISLRSNTFQGDVGAGRAVYMQNSATHGMAFVNTGLNTFATLAEELLVGVDGASIFVNGVEYTTAKTQTPQILSNLK